MKTTGNLKLTAFLILLLALAFWAFFQYSKHTLGDVNPFGEDPYDAVGSFGVQLSMLAALLGLLRALRPYGSGEIPPVQARLALRADGLAVLSLAVTLAADAVALARYPAQWMNSPGGLQLAALTAGMALLTLLAGGPVYNAARGLEPSPANSTRPMGMALGVCAAGLLIMACYPEEWRTGSIVGAVATAMLGMLVLFGVSWALARAMFPAVEAGTYDDVLDDLLAIYDRLKTHAGPVLGMFDGLERLAGAQLLRRLLAWLDPRRHAWNFVLPAALLTGILLMTAEALGEGLAPQMSTVVLVAAVFIGIEGMGVLIGYGLLGSWLGVFRRKG